MQCSLLCDIPNCAAVTSDWLPCTCHISTAVLTAVLKIQRDRCITHQLNYKFLLSVKMGSQSLSYVNAKVHNVLLDSVLSKSCHRSKHTTVHVVPRQKMPPQVLPRQQMPKATFSQPYMCMKKIN